MSAEENKAVVRHVHEQVNKGNIAVFDEVVAPSYARHCQAMPPPLQEIRGVEPLKKFVKENLASFPDWQDKIEFILAEGDKVAYITTSTGTQTGQMGPFPPSGKQVKVVSLIIHRLENGKIAETWISWDNVDFLRQLGHLPPSIEGGE